MLSIVAVGFGGGLLCSNSRLTRLQCTTPVVALVTRETKLYSTKTQAPCLPSPLTASSDLSRSSSCRAPAGILCFVAMSPCQPAGDPRTPQCAASTPPRMGRVVSSVLGRATGRLSAGRGDQWSKDTKTCLLKESGTPKEGWGARTLGVLYVYFMVNAVLLIFNFGL